MRKLFTMVALLVCVTHAQRFTYEMNYGQCRSHNKTNLNLWLPGGTEAEHVRAVIVVPDNTDSYQFATYGNLKAMCVDHDIAILYMRKCDFLSNDDLVMTDTVKIFDIFDTLALVSGVNDLRHAPWITFGKSSQGKFPFFFIYQYPERVVAGITYHGQAPYYPELDWAKDIDMPIPYIAAVGEKEWSKHWSNIVRPNLLGYRTKEWLTNILVVHGVGHGDYENSPVVTKSMVFDYLVTFIERAVELRVPEGYPSDGPFELRQIDPSSGYLADPQVEIMLQGQTMRPDTMVKPWSDVPEADRASRFWIFDRELAADWIAFHTRAHREYYYLTGDLIHNSGKTILQEEQSLFSADIKVYDTTCSPLSLLSSAVDNSGQFRAEVLCPRRTNLAVNADIRMPPDLKMLNYVNGSDLRLISAILEGDTTFKPTFQQLIAADVNRDGVITQEDLTQTRTRALKQRNTFTNPQGTDLSDWTFYDPWSLEILINTRYRISSTYPNDDEKGYSRHRVPSLPKCIELSSSNEDRSIHVSSDRFLGIAFGDVDGQYYPSQSGQTAEITLQDGLLSVKPSSNGSEPITSLDIIIQYDGDITVNGSITPGEGIEAEMAAGEGIIRAVSYSAQPYNLESTAFTIATSGSQINPIDAFALINGNRVEVTFNGNPISAKYAGSQPDRTGHRPGLRLTTTNGTPVLTALTADDADGTIHLVNAVGARLASKALTGRHTTMDLSRFPQGVYFAVLRKGSSLEVIRVPL